MLYYLLLLLAGALQGVMVSLNGQLGNYYSPFAICFFVHGIALILLLAYLLAKKTPLGFKGAPWYVYLVGALGIAIVASTSCGSARASFSRFRRRGRSSPRSSSTSSVFLACRYRNSTRSRFRAMCCWPRA